jgi:WD40 repeat protein
MSVFWRLTNRRLLTRRERPTLGVLLFRGLVLVVLLLALFALLWALLLMQKARSQRRVVAQEASRLVRLTAWPHVQQALLRQIPTDSLDDSLVPLLMDLRYGWRPMLTCDHSAGIDLVGFDHDGGLVGVLGNDERLCFANLGTASRHCLAEPAVAATFWDQHGWVLAGAQGAIELRDPAGRKLRPLRDSGPGIGLMAAQGETLVAAGKTTLELFAEKRWRSIPVAGDREGLITALALDAAHNTVALGTADGRVLVVDSERGTIADSLAFPVCRPSRVTANLTLSAEFSHPIGKVQLSDDGGYLLAVTQEGDVALWPRTGKKAAAPLRLAGCRDQSFTARSAALLGDGRVLIGDSEGRIWMARRDQLDPQNTSGGLPITDIVVSSDNSLFLALTDAGSASLWRRDDHGNYNLTGELSAHSGKLTAAFSKDGSKLVTGGADGQLLLWKTQPSQGASAVAKVGGQAAIAAAALTGTAGAGLDDRNQIHIWDGKGGAQFVDGARATPSSGLAMSRDGSTVAWLEPNHDGARLVVRRAQQPLVPVASCGPELDLPARRAPFALDEHGSRALVAMPTAVRLLTVASGRCEASTLATGSGVTAVSFAGGDNMAIGRENGDIELWSVGRTSPHRLPKLHKDGVSAVLVSDDGRLLASVAEDGSVGVVPLVGSSPWLVERVPVQGEGSTGLSFSPAGKRVAVTRGSTVTVFQTERPGLHRGLLHHDRPLRGVAFRNEEEIIAVDDHGDIWAWQVGIKSLAEALSKSAPIRCRDPGLRDNTD